MRVHLGSDHAGFHLKEALAERLVELGHAPVDHGPFEYDPDDDYPPFVIAAAAAAAAEPDSIGIVIGGSGNGEQIAANKIAGVRSALAWRVEIAQLARQHNNANVLGLGGRILGDGLATSIVDAFLSTPFEGGRHERRVAQIAEIEAEECS